MSVRYYSPVPAIGGVLLPLLVELELGLGGLEGGDGVQADVPLLVLHQVKVNKALA